VQKNKPPCGFVAICGVKRPNIHLGPTLPAFLSPNAARVLVENFGIAGIGKVEDDIKALIG
jgi:hydroxylamine reductase (hybrid-cluster protein)